MIQIQVSKGCPLQTGAESAAEKLEDGGSAEVVLRDLADAARTGISANNGSASTSDTPQQVVRVDGVAEVREYLLLDEDLHISRSGAFVNLETGGTCFIWSCVLLCREL